MQISNILFSVMIFLCMFNPSGLTSAKMMLLAAWILCRISNFANYNFSINCMLLSIFYSFVGVIFLFVGLLNDAPGVLSNFNLYVVYPLLLGFLASTTNSTEVKGLFNVFLYSSVLNIISVMVIMLLEFNGYSLLWLFPNSNTSIGYIPGYTRFSFETIDSLNFTAPFLIGFLGLSILNQAKLEKILFVYIILIVCFLSGRRALWVLSIILLIIIPFVLKYNKRLVGLYFSPMLLLLVIDINYEFINYDTILFFLTSAFDFSSDSLDVGGVLRDEQRVALISGFLDSPIVGHGIGSTALKYGSVRDPEMLWAYELSYLYNLFSLGVIGFFLYGIGVLYICYSLFKISKYSTIGASINIGFICFMISIAVNPWLSKFSFMYIIFFPLAIIVGFNKMSIEKKFLI